MPYKCSHCMTVILEATKRALALASLSMSRVPACFQHKEGTKANCSYRPAACSPSFTIFCQVESFATSLSRKNSYAPSPPYFHYLLYTVYARLFLFSVSSALGKYYYYLNTTFQCILCCFVFVLPWACCLRITATVLQLSTCTLVLQVS